MRAVGDTKTRTITLGFDRSISIDFRAAKMTSDAGFLILREVDQRFNILNAAASQIDDPGSARHTDTPCSNCCGKESIRLQRAMRIAMTPITLEIGYFCGLRRTIGVFLGEIPSPRVRVGCLAVKLVHYSG